MSKGMQQMRLIVMEFGRFTIDSAVEGGLAPLLNYAPGACRQPGARWILCTQGLLKSLLPREFPVELAGVATFHAPFFTERCTRGLAQGNVQEIRVRRKYPVA
jgi:hypothetical protein